MNKYEQFNQLWGKLETATTKNDIDTQNELIQEIENILPFETINEHKSWIDLTLDFKFWEDFENETKRIANRLKITTLKELFKKIETANEIGALSGQHFYCYIEQDICANPSHQYWTTWRDDLGHDGKFDNYKELKKAIKKYYTNFVADALIDATFEMDQEMYITAFAQDKFNYTYWTYWRINIYNETLRK